MPAYSESMTLVIRKLLNTLPEGDLTHLPGYEYPMKGPFNVEMKREHTPFTLQMRKYHQLSRVECQLMPLLVILPLR